MIGIDVSAHQESTPALAGYGFLIARAAYGSHLDGRFPQHIAAARARGLVTGAYLFGRSVDDVADQVAELRAAIAAVGGVDLVALDVERDGSNPAMTEHQARAFIAAIQATGQPIGLYHSTSGYPPDAWGADWRWVADYRPIDEPPIPWDVWQKRGSPLDLDRFDGTADELRSLGGRTMEIPVKATDGQLINIPDGTTILNVDGSKRLTAKGDRRGVVSPFSTVTPGGTRVRAIVWSRPDPDPDLLLGVYTSAVEIVGPWPAPPAVVDCTDAVSRELEAAAARAAEAVRTRP
jgi:hypothetical protein